MKLSDFVQQIKETADLKDHIIYHKYIPEKKAEFSELRLGIELKTALERLGIKKLFSHKQRLSLP